MQKLGQESVSRKFSNVAKLDWKSVENHRNFLAEVAVKLNIKNASDWGKITQKQFCEFGGAGLLQYYKGSVRDCLQSVYKDINWKREFFPRFSRAYWQSGEGRRKFLDEVAIKLNIKKASDWGKVTYKHICEFGGARLLHYYNSSVFNCLSSVYKETSWNREWFFQVPRYHWKSMENRRKFLDEVAIKLDIKSSNEWGRVTYKQIYDFGGGGLLNYYNGSLYDCLQSVYKEIKWKREWFSNVPRYPKTYWNSSENCKKFLDEIAKNSNVTSVSEWKKVSRSLLRNNGGQGLLNKYQGNIQQILKAIYSIDSELGQISNHTSESVLKESLATLFPELAIVFKCRNVPLLS